MRSTNYYKSKIPSEWNAQQFCDVLTAEGANSFVERTSAEPIVRFRAFPEAKLLLELDSSECVSSVRLEWPFEIYEYHFYESISRKIEALEFYSQP